jgi:hypothetical protein
MGILLRALSSHNIFDRPTLKRRWNDKPFPITHQTFCFMNKTKL